MTTKAKQSYTPMIGDVVRIDAGNAMSIDKFKVANVLDDGWTYIQRIVNGELYSGVYMPRNSLVAAERQS
jgi:hypothetical protein